MTRYTFCTLCLCATLFSPAALIAQGGSKPKITNIPGGFFIEWASPVDIAAVQLDKKLTGSFEVMFDVPSAGFLTDVLDKQTPATRGHDFTMAIADYWIDRGKPERAVPLYEESLKRGDLDEKRAIVFQNNLAMIYSSELKQHDKALEIVNRALEARKDNILLLDTKGLILINSGKPAEAVPVLQRAVELSCQVPLYCMHLAHALYQEGRVAPARRYFDPVRDQLIPAMAMPNTSKENKAMFDSLQSALPPVNAE